MPRRERGKTQPSPPVLYRSVTRQDAEQESLSAIAFALEGDPQGDPSSEAVTLDVTVGPAAEPLLTENSR